VIPLTSAGVVFVDDVTKIAAFYQAVTNMALLHSDDRHAVLEVPGFQLTVHALSSSRQVPEGNVSQLRQSAP
jgi:catechol-2,3-dioxygenase